jgi:large subunit ribosomal protein L9
MKVILLNDVSKVGKRYDIKEVSPGFARNLLIPQKKAVFATPELISFYEKLKKEGEEKQKIEDTLLSKNLEKIANIVLVFKEKVNEGGSLYAQITREDIARRLGEEARFEIDPENVHIEKPIKDIGDHKVALLIEGKKGILTVRVEKNS